MDDNLLLINLITLLTIESSVEAGAELSRDIVEEILQSIYLPESSVEESTGRDTLVGLMGTVRWLVADANEKPDRAIIQQRVTLNAGIQHHLANAFIESIKDLGDDESKMKRAATIRSGLRTHIRQQHIRKLITDARIAVAKNRDNTDWSAMAQQLARELDKYSTDAEDDSGIVKALFLKDVEGLEAAFMEGVDETSTEGVITSGWQFYNRMLGDHLGNRRGDMICIEALQHNFKSGFLLNLFKHACIYNTPYMLDATKKPLLVFLSLENHFSENVMWLYANLVENETGEEVDIQTIDYKVAASYLRDKLQQNGYAIYMNRINPSDFSYMRLFNLINSFIVQGYEVHAVYCDYLNMIPKVGCTATNEAHKIRELFRRVRNWMSERKITFFTPHQLNPDAKKLIREGTPRFAQEVVGKGYTDGCSTIDQEIDLEIVINKVIQNGISYLEIARGKHRKLKPTPEKYLYAVRKFESVGGIIDDIHIEDQTLPRIGAAAGADPDGDPEWYV